MCVCLSVYDERGRCLTTLDGCVWVLSSVVSVILSSSSSSLPFCWLFCFSDVRERNGERGEEEKRRRLCGCIVCMRREEGV